MATTTKTPVMVNGLPGKMATLMANKIKQSADFELYPYVLKGSTDKRDVIDLGGTGISLFGPDQRDTHSHLTRLVSIPINQAFREQGIVLDFTTPKAALENAKYYSRNGWNFVMGTTGINAEDARHFIEISAVIALISPNMAKQIVALQKVTEDFAEAKPNSLSGCTIRVKESHQGPDPARPEFKSKRDPSGTAIKLSESFGKLGVEGCPFDAKDIMANPEKYRDTFIMIRDRKVQAEELKVPVEHLDGHGWHTYTITEKRASPSFTGFYTTVRDFMKSSPVFKDYTKTETQDTKDHTKGMVVERLSSDKNVRFRTEFRYDPASYGKSPVLQLLVTHNVSGRNIYGDGAMDCMRFIRMAHQDNPQTGVGTLFSMTNLLRFS